MGIFQSIPFDFGDGSDGAVVLDGVNTFPWANLTGSLYTLLKPISCTTLDISPGVSVDPAGYSISVNDTLTNAGTIISEGTAANPGSDILGPGGESANYHPAGMLSAADIGEGGGAVGVQAGDPNTVADGAVTAAAATGIYGPVGGASGNGGSGGVGAGGVGAAGDPGLGVNIVFKKLVNILYAPLSYTGFLNTNGGGSCGATGAGDTVNAGGNGGGGGPPGGCIAIFAAHVVNSGSIRANGADGGAGESTAAGNTGGGGGGGGGSGGFIYMVYYALTNTGAIEALGGNGAAGGAGFGTGTAGTAGSNGSVGAVLKFNTASGQWE